VAAGRGILDMFEKELKSLRNKKLTAIPLNPPFMKGGKKLEESIKQ
jgi:hypothetical protein